MSMELLLGGGLGHALLPSGIEESYATGPLLESAEIPTKDSVRRLNEDSRCRETFGPAGSSSSVFSSCLDCARLRGVAEFLVKIFGSNS
jgi:hypothetical protein